MPTFAQWLRNRTNGDSDLALLKDYADAHPDTWPWWNDDKSSYERAIDATVTDPTDNLRLKNILNKYYDEWSNTNATRPSLSKTQQLISFLDANLTALLFASFALVVMIVLIYGFSNTRFFTSIANIEQARGLITFLFAFSTIAIILAVTVAIFWLQKDDLEDRFGKAKDLITIVIGVLGTILGFYFGSLAEGENSTRALNIANVRVSSSVAQPGSTVRISATLVGGTRPYTYSIQFADPTGATNTSTMTVKPETSDTGAIAKDVAIPSDVSKPTGITVTLDANDAKGAQAHASSAIVVTPKATQ